MIIKSIEIENYRQYKGPINLEFSLDKNKNFTIVKGTNGAGKTNLLNAITWCLYEKELHKTGNDEDKGPIYNLITKNQLKPGDEFDVKVKLNMVDQYGINTSFKRSATFKCENEGRLSRTPFTNFEVMNDLNNDALGTPEFFIEKNMPEEIEGYFFFDGEKLEDYFDKNSDNIIKDSVYKLSQLHLLDSALDNLEKVKKSYANEIKNLDKLLGQQLYDKDMLDLRLKNSKIKLEDYNNKLEDIDSKLDILRDNLKKVDNKDKDILEREKEQLIKNKRNLENNINKEKKLLNNLIIEKFPFVFGYSAIKYSTEKFKEVKIEENNEQLYSKELLEEILFKNECICGCDLSKNNDSLNTIKKLINEFKTNNINISNEVKSTLRDLNVLMLSVGDVNTEIENFKDNIYTYEKELVEVQENIEFNEFNLSGIDDVEINKLNIEIRGLENEKEELISNRTKLKLEHDDLLVELKQLKEKERSKKLNNLKILKLKNLHDFCDNAIINLETLKIKVLENIRFKVENLTSSQFKKLMWKNNFEKVLINKNYNVKLIDIMGNIVSPSILSAGEKLVLALSFVSALNNISGFDLPFIIDTPMGRLDKEMKNNISKTLPNYMEDKQVTLLVTGEEYTDNFKKGISEKVGYEYRIKVNETEDGTESRIVLNE